MTKVLFKKQMMEVFSWVYRDNKKGVNRSKSGTIRYATLYIILFAVIGAMFFMVSSVLAPLITVGFGWLYFAIMGLVAICMGVVGSVFNTYASLYQAKDNDLLLSMPIPARTIIIVRLSGVFTVGLLYEIIVLIPTLIVWFLNVQISPAVIICTVITAVMISVFVLVLSAVLGWLVALVSGKMKRKNITTVVLSLVFLAAYFFFYSKAFDYLEAITLNPQGAVDVVKNALYPFYLMGLAACGDVISTLIFAAIVCALFAIVYAVISRSFIKLATTNKGAAKAQYKERKAKVRSAETALMIKELRRFTGSATYMLNCGLGLIFFLIAAVALIWFRDDIFSYINEIFAFTGSANSDVLCLVAAAAVFLICSMVDISSPSVSLEGKNIWLVQSLPVSHVQVLMAKVRLHFVLAVVPAAVFIIVVEIMIMPSLALAVLLPVLSVLYIIFSASFGLFLNLKSPNLTWTNEMVPIKQSMSMMVSIFGNWGITFALCALYFPASSVLSPAAYALIVAGILLALSLILLKWIKTRGAEIFAEL
jgi:ABC-2 type transport system permease protein